MNWASRRAAVAAEERRLADGARAASEAEARAEMDALDDAEALERLGLPDPDLMKPGDDFSAFMGRLVPDRLRRRALRRLWGTNPVLANLDGMIDYGEDFTDAATVVENLSTTYQVGKGMLAHVKALAAKAEAEAQGETEEVAAPEPEIALAETKEPEPAPEPVRAEAPTEPAPAEPRPRRMRFEVPA